MATALLLNDDMSMNRINPYTLTGTYGVPVDGSHWVSDGTYTTPYYSGESTIGAIDTNRDLKNFDVMALNDASNMWFNTMPGKPVAPSTPFPARKYQNWDGNLSWVLPEGNYNYVYDRGFIGSPKEPNYVRVKKDSPPIGAYLVIVLLVLAFAMAKKK
jgi:hypothetical protein